MSTTLYFEQKEIVFTNSAEIKKDSDGYPRNSEKPPIPANLSGWGPSMTRSWYIYKKENCKIN